MSREKNKGILSHPWLSQRKSTPHGEIQGHAQCKSIYFVLYRFKSPRQNCWSRWHQKEDVLQIWRKKIFRKLSTIRIPGKQSGYRKERWIFRSYCESKEYVFSEVEKYNDSELSSLLRKFYSKVRTKSGDYYAKKSMQTMRYGLQIGWQVSLTIVSYIFNLFISKIFMRYSKTNTTWFILRSSKNSWSLSVGCVRLHPSASHLRVHVVVSRIQHLSTSNFYYFPQYHVV